jgi:predicted dehydrogenase
VIVEKPMATDAAGCRAILAAEQARVKSHGDVQNTASCRCHPAQGDRCREGRSARYSSVPLRMAADPKHGLWRHGASYFRRWKRPDAKERRSAGA